MKSRLVIHPKAIVQAVGIHQHYRGIRQALADRFERELDACYEYIEERPRAYQARLRDYRHAMVKGFRYRLVMQFGETLWWSTK